MSKPVTLGELLQEVVGTIPEAGLDGVVQVWAADGTLYRIEEACHSVYRDGSHGLSLHIVESA